MDKIAKQDVIHYESVRTPRVRAVCPINPKHRAVVRSTRGRIRRCYCHDCGRPFKISGPPAG